MYILVLCFAAAGGCARDLKLATLDVVEIKIKNIGASFFEGLDGTDRTDQESLNHRLSALLVLPFQSSQIGS
jgi:hypothetical protein